MKLLSMAIDKVKALLIVPEAFTAHARSRFGEDGTSIALRIRIIWYQISTKYLFIPPNIFLYLTQYFSGCDKIGWTFRGLDIEPISSMCQWVWVFMHTNSTPHEHVYRSVPPHHLFMNLPRPDMQSGNVCALRHLPAPKHSCYHRNRLTTPSLFTSA